MRPCRRQGAGRSRRRIADAAVKTTLKPPRPRPRAANRGSGRGLYHETRLTHGRALAEAEFKGVVKLEARDFGGGCVAHVQGQCVQTADDRRANEGADRRVVYRCWAAPSRVEPCATTLSSRTRNAYVPWERVRTFRSKLFTIDNLRVYMHAGTEIEFSSSF